MDRTTRTLVATCAVVAALAWGRLLWSTATKASPAHEIDFIDEQGAPLARWDVHCHGPMYVLGTNAWQRCDRTVDDVLINRLTHFDFDGRVAHLLATPADVADVSSVTGVIPHPDRGLIMLAAEGVLWVKRDSIVRLADAPPVDSACLRLDGRTLEVASFIGLEAQLSFLDLDRAGWQVTAGGNPAVDEDRTLYRAGCRWADDGWRFVWASAPKTHRGEGPVTISLVEASLGGAPEDVGQVQLDVEDLDGLGSAQTPAARRTEDGSVFLDQPLLDLSPWFGVPRSWSVTPPLEWQDGRWELPRLPPGMISIRTASDHVVTAERVDTVLTFELSEHARVGERWLRAEADGDGDLRIQPLDDAFEPQGERSPPVTGRSG